MTETTVSESVEKKPGLEKLEQLIRQKKLDEAQQLCGQLIKTNPKDHAAIHFAGIIALEFREFKHAAQAFEKAISLDSSAPEYHAGFGRALIGLKQVNAARASADKAAALEPEDARTLDTLGVIYSHAGDHAQAVQLFKQAVAEDPDRASYWYNLGTSLRFAGLFDEAEQAFERTLLIKPEFDKALYGLSDLRKQTPENNHIDQLKLRLKDQNKLGNEMSLSFALAKEYDDLGQYPEAFETLKSASKKLRQSMDYSVELDEYLFRAMLEGFDAQNVAAAKPGKPSDAPVFIIGLPRTGTTLTDRIVSSHSAVTSAGELHHMSMLMQIAARAKKPQDFQPALIQAMLTSDLSKLGAKYLEVSADAAGASKHFTDKMPLNFIYAGFILLAMPNAKMICLRRNPLDSCLSNFRQLFALQNPRFAWSYDLLDCGRYYLMFDKLMRHWNELFPGRIFNLQYEDLVDNQEQKSRELIDYLDLDWEDQCLQFHKNTAAVDTASSVQVREPMNRSGLKRWKNYEQHLQPLKDFFAAQNIDY